MSFSAGIVQGRPARSGFGLLDGGDLGPTRCAVTKRGPHEGTHRAPIICQACHQTPLFLPAKRASRVFATDRIFSALATLRYRASASSPTSRTLRAARRTPAGCGVTKHVLVAHVPEPQDPDGVTELARFGSRFGDHVVAQPGGRCSRASRIRPLSGGPSGNSPLCTQAGGFSHPAGRLYPPGAAVRASSQNLTGYPSRCSAIESGCRGAGQRGIP
jgi:hypothetical protein